ncbi:DExH-box splicing factor binding site-domain-containing protein [Papiliotrema laurentii]|uniref:DExH-box splicing factor binding site-domain-containing protein n=1 Tax=Papiliotrema laurentii TaxID=5418 RepID=A0AAD9CZF6_PAPLA|nr:DExH-box splicing factor binding site-domain-containing protein [Papiliotrema laurentii]
MSTPISFTVKPPAASGTAYRPSPLGGAPRHGAPSRRLFEQHGDDEDEDEDGHSSGRSRRVRDERIEGMANGKALGGEKPAGPLVIPALPNRDWRQSSRRSVPIYKPEGQQRTEEDLQTHERTGDGPQRSGLRRIVKQEEVKVEDGQVQVKKEEGMEVGANGHTYETAAADAVHVKTEPGVKEEPLSLEEQALRAVLAGNTPGESEEDRKQRELVIGVHANTYEMSEAEAYKRDVAALPEESTLDDYATVPVEAFGMAMARGMGWDPKSSENTTVHEPKVRPQLLGLGATPMDATIKPTHAKHGASKKDRQADRNARTGRGFVATSLLVKKERETSVITSSSSRAVSPSNGDSDGSRRRRRDDDYDSGREYKRERSDRNGDDYRKRERERDRDRDRDSRRNREYETEEDRARRKAREYETDEERAKRKARERERVYETEGERAKRKAREREREGEYETEEERARRKARERERERDRERRYDHRERDRDRGGDRR